MDFNRSVTELKETIDDIRCAAHAAHADVNQFYGHGKPYGFHLDMVAEALSRYGQYVCTRHEDVLPLFFGAYFHDSIEDARLSYNDLKKKAVSLGLTEPQAFMAAEIVYALTNDKGRTRQERAGENYYKGIRETPYAPFCKMCDRLANLTHSAQSADHSNRRMSKVYAQELPHFISSITVQGNNDVRFSVPEAMIEQAYTCLGVMSEEHPHP